MQVERKIHPQRAVHLDFHTMPGVYDVGRDFKAEEFADTLARAGVQYITVFARCNLGFAYYPTRIGTVHPGLKIDLLGSMVKACHKRAIRVAAYLNAGIDHEHALRRREWCKVNKEGKVFDFQQMRESEYSHWFRLPCLNTGYKDHLLGMVKEVLEKYPVDGLFLDCFGFAPCYGVECLDGMKALGMDIFNDEEVGKYVWIITKKFYEETKKLAGRIRPGINMLFNGLPYRWQPTHLELEILPTGGHDVLPMTVRYARTLEKPFLTMTGRFHRSWGDLGGLRPEQSLLYDLLYSIGNGGTCMVGDHMHPRGRLEKAVYDRIGAVYAKIRQYEPWVEDAKPLVDMVVIDPNLAVFPQKTPSGVNNVKGATRILFELKHQFDVSDGLNDLSKYKVIILPDNIALTGGLKQKIRRHLQNKGVLISSAFSGLNPDKTDFALKEYALKYEGPEPYDYTFFKADISLRHDLPDMLTTIYAPGIAMRPKSNAKTLAKLYKPYFNRKSWDMYHENLYIPPEKDSGRPALVKMGNIFHFSFPIFTAYFDHAVLAYKYLLRNCLEAVFPKPLIKTSNCPSFCQATVLQKDNYKIISLFSYVPELRGPSMQIIEEPILVRDAVIALRLDGCRCKEVFLAPSRERLEYCLEDGYVKIQVPEICGYAMIIVETHTCILNREKHQQSLF